MMLIIWTLDEQVNHTFFRKAHFLCFVCVCVFHFVLYFCLFLLANMYYRINVMQTLLNIQILLLPLSFYSILFIVPLYHSLLLH